MKMPCLPPATSPSASACRWGTPSVRPQAALRGRFALLPARGEVITPQHVRELMEREGV